MRISAKSKHKRHHSLHIVIEWISKYICNLVNDLREVFSQRLYKNYDIVLLPRFDAQSMVTKKR